MGLSKSFERVKLFCGVIFREHNHFETACRLLEEQYNRIDVRSPVFDFLQTRYYINEMGEPLLRSFVTFRDLIQPEMLVEIKRWTNQLEAELSSGGRRVVNLDPGFISSANVIIATTKNHYHRIPLNKGIYAHMEYIFKKKEIYPLEWTYPDFRNESHLTFFRKLYRIYKEEPESNGGGNQ